MAQQFTLEPRGPFSLHSSISFLEGFAPAMHGRGGQVGHLHLAFVPDGERRAAGACVRSRDGEIVVEVSGAAEPSAAARQVQRILSLDVDGSGFADVGERDPAIGRLQARYPGLRPVSFPSPFEAGAWFVISQRIRAAQGVALKARIGEQLGERVAICGEERIAFPAPSVVAELEGVAGLPERKLATLRALAQAAVQGALDGEHLRAMGGEAAVEELQRLPGVGPFTAQGIVVRGAGEPDYLATAAPRCLRGVSPPLAPPTGSGPCSRTVPARRAASGTTIRAGYSTAAPRLARAAALAYGLDAPLSAEELARRGEAWRPYRSWVSVLLRLGLEATSHGSRRTVSGAPRRA
jgi:DNA-3-methyladenine glycosylase II